ncbi:hypothetical protein [Streptomyces decoyicus]|uniref:hypothetical protein n=1 Tax=Streptomyces decoyicus TaxID=249567 RepID=UPI00386960C7
MISKKYEQQRPAQPATNPPSPRAPAANSDPRLPQHVLGASLHPDFELYDNVGRTNDQIHAYNTNSPTSDDLHRWAAQDAIEFADSLALAEPDQGITACADQLKRARTTAEFHAVTEAVLGDGGSALGALHEFLESAADWCDHNQEPEIATRYRGSAVHLAQLGDQLAFLAEDHLARTYASAPATRPQHREVPVQAPSERPPRTPPPSAPRRTR